jgi:DNA-directed RNA polymerase subunit RPC12/RpoP
MTPIEELRNGLDERGVRHMDFTKCGTGRSYPKYEPDRTHWSAHGGAFKFTSQEVDGILYVKTSGSNKWVEMTPEQAISATVGVGTCHCTTPDDAWCFSCSSCGKSFPRNELHIAHNHGEINYCPNCGRRIVG